MKAFLLMKFHVSLRERHTIAFRLEEGLAYRDSAGIKKKLEGT